MSNTYKYGLSNVFYALIEEKIDETTGAITTEYGTPKAWPGAVSVSFSAQGGNDPFYADNGVYAMLNNNNGYSGDFESALIPEDILVSVLGQHKDATTGLIYESGDDKNGEFALMFQFEGDAEATRHVFYRCTLTRPNVEGSTQGENKEVKTESVTITCMKRKDADHLTKGYMPKSGAKYDDFFKSVILPSTSAKAEG